MREACPRESHRLWRADRGRPDPVDLIEQSNEGRLPELVPLRHGRMLQTPFTFYRGAALNMAVDLATTPSTGAYVQACGDAHLGNFRCFATPERRVIFDIHDLDETLPAPWEWDVKRLAASFVLACRVNPKSSDARARDAVESCVRSYREHMAEFASERVLDVWYASFEAEDLFARIEDTKVRARTQKRLNKARNVCAFADDFPKLVDTSGEAPALRDNPPTTYHHLQRGDEEFHEIVGSIITHYRDSLGEDRRVLLDRYRVKDMAIRVVGVGSVGTVCSVVLFMANAEDPLFLQVKEARRSVLEPFAGESVYANQGQRVIVGHRIMQAASDVFLGWTKEKGGRHFYVRQLRDAKMKFDVERFKPSKMIQFARWCGATLARAHARSGEPSIISGYLGKKSDAFDRAIGDFALAYADQTERDFEVLRKAVKSGRLKAEIHA